MIFKEDLGTGYMYCYNPKSPFANGAGKVMEHVYVMCLHIGRDLLEDEVVHHKDRNKKNNAIDNLELMTNESHARLHALEDREHFRVNVSCNECGKMFECNKSDNRLFCGHECSSSAQRKFNPSKEELLDMVWKYPSTTVAKYYGVSDKAVGKRCKLLGIDKPPRGYWRKLETSK